MPFDLESLIYYSLIFLVLSTGIQLLAMWKAKTKTREDNQRFQQFLPKQDPAETRRGTNDPIVVEKVDEQTFRKIDRIMKGF